MGWRLAVLTAHPIQHPVPFHAHLAREPELALEVFFCRDFAVQRFAARLLDVPRGTPAVPSPEISRHIAEMCVRSRGVARYVG